MHTKFGNIAIFCECLYTYRLKFIPLSHALWLFSALYNHLFSLKLETIESFFICFIIISPKCSQQASISSTIFMSEVLKKSTTNQTF